jgi:hypothetical protein
MLQELVFLVCLASPRPAVQTCDRQRIAEGLESSRSGSVTERISMISKKLSVACDGVLPQSVVDALDSFHVTETSEHGPAMLMALRDAPEFVAAGCERWEEEFSSRAAPGDKLRSIYQACEIGKLDLVTEEEMVSVADLGVIYVSAPLYKWLLRHGYDPAAARGIVRSLLGLSAGAKRASPEGKGAAAKKKRQ